MTNKLNSPPLNSRVTKDDVTVKEKWLGYLLGPAGGIAFKCRACYIS